MEDVFILKTPFPVWFCLSGVVFWEMWFFSANCFLHPEELLSPTESNTSYYSCSYNKMMLTYQCQQPSWADNTVKINFRYNLLFVVFILLKVTSVQFNIIKCKILTYGR